MSSKYTTTKVNLSNKDRIRRDQIPDIPANPWAQDTNEIFLFAVEKLCTTVSCLRLASDGILESNQ